MKQWIETILDENGFEIMVGYDYEFTPSFFVEGHGLHDIGNYTTAELTSVVLLISGSPINLLPLLSEEQKSFIINQLNYE